MEERGVIFDVDGVLIDSYRPHQQSWMDVAREHGFIMTPAQFAATFGRTSREIIAQFWGEGLEDAAARAIDDRKEALYREIIRNDFPAMDGAVDLVRALAAAGFRLAVGSSGPPANVELTLERLGCADAFSAVVTGRDVRRGKPDPQVFQIAASRLALPPERCAVVEDAPVGVAAANAAGMVSIALLGTATAEKLSGAHLVLDSLRALTAEQVRSLIDANA